MSSDPEPLPPLTFRPLDAARWSDLERLFGERGACGGCWCMWWRLPRAEFTRQKGAGNRQTFRRLVESGEPTGVLAYAGAEPVAWCAIAPRDSYPGLERSRILKPVDDEPVWSVTCLFVLKPYRRRGITVPLLNAAVAYAGAHGARIVEGYPVEPKQANAPDAFVWTGLASAFRHAGFEEVLRRSPTRPIMRRTVTSAED
jgi:GNAT superfamily N-acetyltransferase